MLATIQLENQLGFQAREVGYVVADWMLPAEAIPSELSHANPPPDEALRVRHVCTELSGCVAESVFWQALALPGNSVPMLKALSPHPALPPQSRGEGKGGSPRKA